MEEKLEPFKVRGTKEKLEPVKADDILNAIAEGRDIDIEYAVVVGDLNIKEIADRFEQKDGKLVIEENIRMPLYVVRLF